MSSYTSFPALHAHWWKLTVRSCSLPVHVITYSVVPVHLRVLWIDVVEVAWVAILSACVSAPASPQEPAPSTNGPVRVVAPPVTTPPQLPLDVTCSSHRAANR